MLKSRLIPCLLLKGNGLYNSQRFSNFKYIGDPLNTVRIFNQKKVDELLVLDIDATALNKSPNFSLIAAIARECNMPLCYGGGIKNVQDATRLISLGVEKVAVSSGLISNPSLASDIVNQIGSQSLVGVIDYRSKSFRRSSQVVLSNGSKFINVSPLELALRFESLGVGEILLNSVEKDGTMEGYDLIIPKLVKENINVPLSVLGGAGSISDVRQLFNEVQPSGLVGSSIFVYQGKYRAVLLSYPNRNLLDF